MWYGNQNLHRKFMVLLCVCTFIINIFLLLYEFRYLTVIRGTLHDYEWNYMQRELTEPRRWRELLLQYFRILWVDAETLFIEHSILDYEYYIILPSHLKEFTLFFTDRPLNVKFSFSHDEEILNWKKTRNTVFHNSLMWSQIKKFSVLSDKSYIIATAPGWLFDIYQVSVDLFRCIQ